MIAIRNIDRYRDGGTLSIKCHFGFTTKDGTIDIRVHETEICIDNKIGSKTKGTVWLGYPNKDRSELIVHEEVLEYIHKSIKNHIKWENKYCDEAMRAIKDNITPEEEDI